MRLFVELGGAARFFWLKFDFSRLSAATRVLFIFLLVATLHSFTHASVINQITLSTSSDDRPESLEWIRSNTSLA